MEPIAIIDETHIWTWLDEIPDPEIPVISVVDLGVVRKFNFRNLNCPCMDNRLVIGKRSCKA